MARPLSDPQSRLTDYQRRADACIAKAERARDETTQGHYMRLAEMYLQLVEMEVKRMELRKAVVVPVPPPGPQF